MISTIITPNQRIYPSIFLTEQPRNMQLASSKQFYANPTNLVTPVPTSSKQHGSTSMRINRESRRIQYLSEMIPGKPNGFTLKKSTNHKFPRILKKVWRNDGQTWTTRAQKHHGAIGESPGQGSSGKGMRAARSHGSGALVQRCIVADPSRGGGRMLAERGDGGDSGWRGFMQRSRWNH